MSNAQTTEQILAASLAQREATAQALEDWAVESARLDALEALHGIRSPQPGPFVREIGIVR